MYHSVIHPSLFALGRGVYRTDLGSGWCGHTCLGGGTVPPRMPTTGSLLIVKRIDIEVVDVHSPHAVGRPLLRWLTEHISQRNFSLGE